LEKQINAGLFMDKLDVKQTLLTLLWFSLQLMTSQFIDAERLLKVIPHARLLEIQALLQKHLGDHKGALRLVPC